MKIDFKYDGGHGWGVVPRALLIKLNLLNKISNYSYINKDKTIIYLEEDCDLPLFLNELKKLSIKFEFNFINDGAYSPIRNFQRYSC